MKASILLCDSALVSEGKLFILGGGWTVTGPGVSPMAIALKIDVEWGETSAEHHWELFLQDQDGSPIFFETPEGPQAVEVRGDFQVGDPVGIPLGASIPVNLAVNLGPLPLPPGSSFSWRLTIDGQSEEGWVASFSTREAPDGEPLG
ncbi:MAG: DUF6941 family protein [Acidimicrobiales bacterium]